MTRRAHMVSMCALAACAFVGVLLFYLPFERPQGMENARPLLDGWRYYTSSDPETKRLESADRYFSFDTRDTLTMVREMAEPAAHPALLVRLTYMRARIYLDDALLYENLTDPPGENPGARVCLIGLPDDYLGGQLRLELSSPYPLYAYSPDPIYFGDAGALMARITADSMRDMALMALLAISGLLLLSLGVWGARAGWNARAQWTNCCFGLFSLLYGLSLASETALYRLTFPAILGGNVNFVMWFLFPIPLLGFLWLKCLSYRRAALALMLAFTAASTATLLGALFGLWALPATLTVMNPVYIALVAAVALLVALESAKKNPFFRLVWPAFALIAGSAALSAIDIGGFYAGKELLRIAGLLLVLVLVWMDSARGLRENRRRQDEERQLLEIKGHLAAEQFKAAEALDGETRFLRHEIRHHLAALTVLQRKGDLSGIGNYLSELTASEPGPETTKYCEHPLVSAMLAKTERDCARAGVAFSCDAFVPDDLTISEGDLSVLLLNMLENAVEAARLAPEATRWVAAQVRVKDNYLVISCQNARRAGDIAQHDGRFLSTKADPRFHGYGIPAMRQVVEKRGSKLNIDYDEHSFSVKTILRLDTNPNHEADLQASGFSV